jgi:hypothetical protein
VYGALPGTETGEALRALQLPGGADIGSFKLGARVGPMVLGELFAQRNVKGALTRAGIAWVLITPAVAAAKIWWSGRAALFVGILGVTLYIALANRYLHRHGPPPAA